MIKLKSCLHIVMPFAVANDCKHFTTSLYRCRVDTVYITWVTRPCNNGLDCYLASPEVWKCSAFDRPQGFGDKANFTGKMASRRDGFWGIKIPGFFCPAGTYGMYVSTLSGYMVVLHLLQRPWPVKSLASEMLATPLEVPKIGWINI